MIYDIHKAFFPYAGHYFEGGVLKDSVPTIGLSDG